VRRPLMTLATALALLPTDLAASGSGVYGLCESAKSNASPDFTAAHYPSSSRTGVVITNDNPAKLQLQTGAEALDLNNPVILPTDQDLSAQLIYDHAGGGASNTLGWLYYDDLVRLGFINENGTSIADDPNNSKDDTLVVDADGIPLFYKALYNLDSRTYWGGSWVDESGVAHAGRRCSRTFSHTYKDLSSAVHTVVLQEPEIAIQKDCRSGVTTYTTGGPKRWKTGTGYSEKPTSGGVVGETFDEISDDISQASVYVRSLSDGGLFPHIPNLLEPQDALNGSVGIGHLVFLSGDDDPNSCIKTAAGQTSAGLTHTADSAAPECLAPWLAQDRLSAASGDGLPDYKASAFDTRGQVKAGADPDAAIGAADRVVPLGRVQGNREIVFFLVVYVKQIYGPATDSCFRINSDGTQCDLWFHSDINVHFSRSFLNPDLNQQRYPLPSGTPPTLKTLHLCSDPTNKTCTEWIDASGVAKLQTSTYNNVKLASSSSPDVIDVALNTASAANELKAPHFIVASLKDDPLRWIIGVEDQNASGDRTFNDVTFLINKQNNGTAQSGVVSGSIPLTMAQYFTLTDVNFTRDDDPSKRPAGSSADCSTSSVTYEIALDCRACSSNCDQASSWVANPSPTWFQLDPVNGSVSTTSDPSRTNPKTHSVDLQQLGKTGSQLCWRATFYAPSYLCTPTINSVSVTWNAKKTGDYSDSSVSAIANAVVYGTFEVPGASWYVSGGRSKSLYSGQYDMSYRGHTYLKTLYAPESPKSTVSTVQWDAGAVLRSVVAAGDPETTRKLYTMSSSGARDSVANQILSDDAASPAFPDSLCSVEKTPGVFKYDLDASGGACQVSGAKSERQFLRQWLYGWENKFSGLKRAWPMGGVQLSTPAVIGPAGYPTWYANTTDADRLAYASKFLSASAVANRSLIVYEGTTAGYLHAFDAGKYVVGDDLCTSDIPEHRGYFARAGGCGAARNYGTGAELFAYLPRKLLPNYVNNYVGDTGDRAALNASPSVADVDLGGLSGQAAWTPSSTDPAKGAKTALVMSAGPTNSLAFALDITDPTSASFPTPMWEFSPYSDELTVGAKTGTTRSLFALLSDSTPVLLPDDGGSRHSPPIVRMQFGTTLDSSGNKVIDARWVTAVATDYTPAMSSLVGAVYLLDMRTGKPVTFGKGTSAGEVLGGVVSLSDASAGGSVLSDPGEGVGGEVAALDVDLDGNYDVLYVPSTSGKVYRINLTDVDTSRPLGRVVRSCVVADAVDLLTNDSKYRDVANAPYQRIYSSLSTKLVTGTKNAVQLFFGTANDPSSTSDAEDLKTGGKPTHYVFAYQDADPLGATCKASPLWVRALDPGQVIWGGVEVSRDAVFAATAVGTSSDACNLDPDTSGKLYALSQTTGSVAASVDLGTHAISTPVVHDEHVMISTADGKTLVLGDRSSWNNTPASAGTKRATSVIWSSSSSGKLPK
jgi:type IV pilus assembly protein PilY1